MPRYGPDRDGEFHPLAVKALAETGAWLRVNGEVRVRVRARARVRSRVRVRV